MSSSFREAAETQRRLHVAFDRGKVYEAPSPNTDAHSVIMLRYGNRDWQDDIDNWKMRNRKLVERSVRAREYIDFRKELGMEPSDHVFIYDDPYAVRPTEAYVHFGCRSLWDPQEFEKVILSDGSLLAATMVAVSSGCDTGQIMKLGEKILSVFKDVYIPINDKSTAEYSIKYRSVDPLECTKRDWDLAIMLLKTGGSMILARFLVSLFFMVNDIWTENSCIIAKHLPMASIPDDSKQVIAGLDGTEFDDDPAVSANELANTIERRNRMSSGTEMASLEDIGDEFI